MAALPGIAYIHEATRPPYNPDSYWPTQYRAALRDFLAWPARLSGARTVTRASSPIAEVVRYDAPDRAVLFVTDHAAPPTERFTIELDDVNFARAFTATGLPVEVSQPRPGAIRLSLPLHIADAIVLTAKP